jgi:hypothetical protein
MNTNKYIAWCSACIVVCVGIMTIILDVDIRRNNTSSPVEEMYHRQLVVTLDSILDARFGPSCYEEYIDTVSANTFHTRLGGNLSPME